MVRKKGKAVSKKKLNDGEGSGGSAGVSDANARPSASTTVSNFVGSSGGENSAPKSAIDTPREDQSSKEKKLTDDFYEKLVKLHHWSGLSLV